MFKEEVYVRRRARLRKQIGSGIVLFMGNKDMSINYFDNTYLFRQDSSFLYFFGLDEPNLAGVIDIDNDKEIIFGDKALIEDIIWSGNRESLNDKAVQVGIKCVESLSSLNKFIASAVGHNRKIHYLPQYRCGNFMEIESLLGFKKEYANFYASKEMISAVAAQRIVKSDCEIGEIRKAIDISRRMYEIAFDMAKPGVYEREVAGAIEGYALSKGSRASFPAILSVKGEILHNHSYENIMNDGDIFICDSGVESPMHYASDITRTIPVGKQFTQIQKDIYDIVLRARTDSINMMKEGVYFLDVHLNASKIITQGLIDMELMNGSCDDIVEIGAHALFFPHGLGHILGLDVHDMESLGEDYVGYDKTVKRSSQFGLASLRFAKKLKANYVMTVEPGIYFIPELIKIWKEQGRFDEFINYDKVEKMIGFGGVRIEDDILVTKSVSEILSKGIPNTIKEIELLKDN